MKLRMKRGVSKIRQMSSPFQNLMTGGTRSLVRQKARKSIYINQALVYYVKIIFLLRGAPGHKDASSQECGSLSCKDLGDKNTEQVFLSAVCGK